jgi:hypothetical protein
MSELVAVVTMGARAGRVKHSFKPVWLAQQIIID